MPQATRAADFLNTLGVNTHFHQADQYNDTAAGVRALEYLGIKHIREAQLPDAEYDALAAAGIKFDLFVYPGLSPAENVANAKALVQRHPGMVVSIEGPNEVDLWNVSYDGKDGVEGAQAYQAELFRLVNEDPLLRDIPVVNFSWGVGPPDKPGEADIANVHAYRPNGLQPINGMSWHLDYQQGVMPGKDMFLTETGYYTLPNDDHWGGVDDRSQAAMTLNTFFRADAYGVERTFLYQLLDQYNDGRGREEHFGLFNVDFSPKPAADAIRNLTAILADSAGDASGFATGGLDYAVSGLPEHGGTKLLQEADGTFNIAVWAEPDIWDEGANAPITAPDTPVTLRLGQAFASVKVYDPLTGTDAIATAQDTDTVTVNVTDHPLIIELGGGGGAEPAPVEPAPNNPAPGTPATSTPATLTVGSGPDSLVLQVSQNAYQGDAQYTVSVDGEQIGGTLTAQALRGSGQSDTVTVLGDWAAGEHTVSVGFLNDAWGGTDDTDRNLYVDGATYNGDAVADAALAFFEAGSAGFGFTEAAPPEPPPAGSTTIGAGADSLVLEVSQDAYRGDAQYTVSVDGAQVGGVLTAQALRGSGQSDTVTVLGDWAEGGHEVTVTFLNDAWAGTADTDRNLYVDGATYNGQALDGASRTLLRIGSATIGFDAASPASLMLEGAANSGTEADLLFV